MGGAEWVELFIMLTKGMGEPTYGLLGHSQILSRSRGEKMEKPWDKNYVTDWKLWT